MSEIVDVQMSCMIGGRYGRLYDRPLHTDVDFGLGQRI